MNHCLFYCSSTTAVAVVGGVYYFTQNVVWKPNLDYVETEIKNEICDIKNEGSAMLLNLVQPLPESH